MHICMIIDNPETAHHPVIGIMLQKLSAIHNVRVLDVRQLTGAEALAQEERHPQADLYLLKSHAVQALEVAHVLEQRGASVVNSWAATLACQDRELQGRRMKAAGLPWPDSYYYDTLGQLLEQADTLAALPFPLIVKSRYSSRGDLVAKVDSAEQLRAYAPQWSQEPVALQKFMPGDGWDIKLWVIGQQVFAARRRTPLAGAGKENYPFAPDAIPEAWVRIARAIGRAFNLHLYGVDLLISDDGPIVVDVNSFPGFRGVAGADDALVTLVENLLLTQGERDGSLPAAETRLSISALPSIVTQLFARAQHSSPAHFTGAG